MNSKNTKTALLFSVVSVMLCFAMLLGSTYAWFTDKEVTGVNTLSSGNLDIELYAGTVANGEITYNTAVDESTKLFDDEADWEPGHTEVAYLKIENAGSLAVKYALTISAVNEVAATSVTSEEIMLSKILKFDVVEIGEDEFYATRSDAINAAVEVGTLSTTVITGSMAANADVRYLALIVYMPESVSNEANHNGTAPSIQLGATLVATQDTVEDDSFNKFYDETAPLPAVPVNYDVTVTGDIAADTATTLMSDDESVTVEIPANAVAEDTTLAIDISTSELEPNTVTYNIDVLAVAEGGATEEAVLASAIKVTLNIGKGLKNVSVTHTGASGTQSFTSVTALSKLADEKFYYDSTSGVLTICSDEFSPYEITFTEADYSAKIGTEKYTSLDAALAAANDGDTVTVLADSSMTAKFTSTKNITLDLNGCYVSNKGITVTSGTFTLNDSVGGGVTKGNNFSVTGGELVMNAGTVYIKNGECVSVNGGIFTMNGGTLSRDGANGMGRCLLVQAGTVNINGGKIFFDGVKATSNGPLNVYGNCTVNISGGVIESANGYYAIVCTKSTAVFNISGGAIYSPIAPINKGDVNVTGGSFITDPTAMLDTESYESVYEGGKYTVVPKQ